jgi:hypothetical protein
VYDHYDPFYYPYYWGWGWGYPYYRHPYYGRPPHAARTRVYIRQTLPGPSTAPRRVR